MASIIITNEGPFVVLSGLFEDLTAGYLPYWDGDSLANSNVYYDSVSGWLGVGTVPETAFHILLADSTGTNFSMDKISDTANQGPGIVLRRARGTVGSKTVVQTSDTLGGIQFQGWSASYGGWRSGVRLRAFADAEWDTLGDTTDAPARFSIDTVADGSASPTTRFTIDCAGDIYNLTGSFILPASEYVNFGGSLGSSSYGFRDNAGAMEVKDSGGNWRELKAVAVGGYYFNSTGVDPATELGYGTWTQVAQGQFLVGAT